LLLTGNSEKPIAPTPKALCSESKRAAHKGGEVAGKARKDLEQKTRKKVVSPENYLKERLPVRPEKTWNKRPARRLSPPRII